MAKQSFKIEKLDPSIDVHEVMVNGNRLVYFRSKDINKAPVFLDCPFCRREHAHELYWGA